MRRRSNSDGIYHAKRHILRLAHPGWVTVTLEADRAYPAGPDTYVMILAGAADDGSGRRLEHNDDHRSDYRTHWRNSRIADRYLPAGVYTVEATTYYRHDPGRPAHTTGDYTLTVAVDHTPRVPQHPERLEVEVGSRLSSAWLHEPDSASVRLSRPHPIPPGLDATVSVVVPYGEHVSGARQVSLSATATIPGEHTLAFVYDNGGHTVTKHTVIDAECAAGQVTLPLGCVTPVRAKATEFNSELRPPPSGHDRAVDCTLDGLPSEARMFTCRRLVESREYVSKTDPRILAASEPTILDNRYGRTVQIEVDGQTEPEQYEGCQSVSERYWQCDYYADLLWYRTVASGTTWNYYWSAFVDGVVRPTDVLRHGPMSSCLCCTRDGARTWTRA